MPQKTENAHRQHVPQPLSLALHFSTTTKIVGKEGTGLPPPGAGARANARRRNGGARATEVEGQGTTSWSSDDLRVKYRAERGREEAYQAFRLEEQVAEALEKDYGQASAHWHRNLRLSIP